MDKYLSPDPWKDLNHHYPPAKNRYNHLLDIHGSMLASLNVQMDVSLHKAFLYRLTNIDITNTRKSNDYINSREYVSSFDFRNGNTIHLEFSGKSVDVYKEFIVDYYIKFENYIQLTEEQMLLL